MINTGFIVKKERAKVQAVAPLQRADRPHPHTPRALPSPAPPLPVRASLGLRSVDSGSPLLPPPARSQGCCITSRLFRSVSGLGGPGLPCLPVSSRPSCSPGCVRQLRSLSAATSLALLVAVPPPRPLLRWAGPPTLAPRPPDAVFCRPCSRPGPSLLGLWAPLHPADAHVSSYSPDSPPKGTGCVATAPLVQRFPDDRHRPLSPCFREWRLPQTPEPESHPWTAEPCPPHLLSSLGLASTSPRPARERLLLLPAAVHPPRP